MTDLAFQIPSAILWGGIAVAAMMAWFTAVLHRRGVAPRRIATLLVLRVVFLATLVLLVARPVWTSRDPREQTRNQVALLIDCSQSMSVRERDRTRYEQAVEFARDALLPAVDQSRLEIRPILFADDAREASGVEIAAALPDGPATNLGRAIVHSVLATETPPLVAIVLTDGIVTNPGDHSRAVAAVVTHAVPIVAIGFGSQAGGRVVSLDDVDAPAIAEPGQQFRVTARLRATGDSIPAFELLLLRDGQLVDRRKVDRLNGPRTWTEGFEVSAEVDGLHSYAIRVMPPADPSVTVVSAERATMVRIVSSSEIRVLYVQGGLTWDYKFAHIAVSRDPTIRLSGLSRTARTSKFFENVQSDIDLVDGFPNTIEKLSEFRVVVVSNLRPGDLTPHQQQLLAEFCGELGGGVLMIGGPQTFNASWRDSRLEELLPVRFAVLSNRNGNQRFRIQPTDVALLHPIFQISDDMTSRAAWSNLPQFTNRAVVDDVKPAAEIWLESGQVGEAGGHPVLMASQRYGNGLASVICMQNLWQWRLARDSNPDHFDRFWVQLFRYLAEAGREVFTLTLSDPQPAPGDEVELRIEHRATAGEQPSANRRVRLRVQDSQQHDLLDRSIDLEAGRQATVTCTPDTSGMLTATLLGPGNTILASRTMEVRDVAAELASTARNMETLRQFAGISGGVAVEAEACGDLSVLLKDYLDPDEPPQLEVAYALPAGTNGWTLAVLLACISAEWLCRKQWGMI